MKYLARNSLDVSASNLLNVMLYYPLTIEINKKKKKDFLPAIIFPSNHYQIRLVIGLLRVCGGKQDRTIITVCYKIRHSGIMFNDI